MAITKNGTKNSLPDGQLPTGYTRPTVTDFTDWKYVRTVQLSILKATVENANPVTTMTNIITNGTVGCNKQVADIVDADFIATGAVTVFSDLIALTNNLSSMATGATAYTATAASYIATVNIYIKTP